MLSGYRPLVILAVLLVVAGIVVARGVAPSAPDVGAARSARCTQVSRDFADHQSDSWVVLYARVERTLPDETGGRIHQRFIVACPSGQTVLIVNDVSVGERVPVHPGEPVGVRGIYIWNSEGGLVHFTHHAAGGPAGWIAIGGRVYS